MTLQQSIQSVRRLSQSHQPDIAFQDHARYIHMSLTVTYCLITYRFDPGYYLLYQLITAQYDSLRCGSEKAKQEYGKYGN